MVVRSCGRHRERSRTAPSEAVSYAVVRQNATLGGEPYRVARNGLGFTTLTAGWHAARADTPHDLATALQPIA